jgi:hypothetical protein
LARVAVAARSAGCWYARGEMPSSFQATSGLYGPVMAGRIIVGTSSWADPGFVKEWYPPKMPAAERLPWYAEHFEAVELNSSFYAIPDRNTVHKWVADTPERFGSELRQALADRGDVAASIALVNCASEPAGREAFSSSGDATGVTPVPDAASASSSRSGSPRATTTTPSAPTVSPRTVSG